MSAEEPTVHADLFAGEGTFTPRPAWQVIEAARRQQLTGELSLATTPTTHVYLRDGQIYFAERSTDGGLGVRLLVEGVITRQQMGKGALLVSGVEHLGRMFQRDTTIDRQSVELCVELMTDDVLTAMANDVIDHYTMTMYKRHPNGIDRWLPTRIEVITHIVDGAHLAEPGAQITAAASPAASPDVVARAASAQPTPVNGSPRNGTPTTPASEPDVEQATVPDIEQASTADVTEPDTEPVSTADTTEPVTEPTSTADVTDSASTMPVVVRIPPEAAHPGATKAPATHPAATEPPVPQPPAPQPVIAQAPAARAVENIAVTQEPQPAPQPAIEPPSHASIGSELAAAAAAGLLHTPVPATAEALFADPPLPSDSGISLAQSAVDAIMSTAIADEVAEAVRRALAAIDAAAQPTPAM